MNKARRAAIAALQSQLQELVGKIADIRSELETIRDEETDYFEAMPESLQGSDKGQAAEAAMDALNEAIQNCEQMESEGEYADGSLDTACE